MDPLIGQTLYRYKVLSLLGAGGMGAVYKARDVTLQRDVALKVMHPQFALQPNFQERFLLEARTAARFDQPSIVKVHDFGQQDGMLYIVMEFIPGDNLGKMIRNLRAKNQWIPLTEAVQLMRQICLALDYIHKQGITHRDIKPDNIMLKPEPCDGLPYRPVLTDLGLAKLAEGGVFTQDGTSMGTPAYMSPEQALGKPTDPRSDVYSLGILLYELAVGRLPFQVKTLTEAIRCHTQEPPPPPQSMRSDFPDALQAVILKAIEKDPAKRYQTAADMAKALAENTPAGPAVTVTATAPETQAAEISLITQLQQSMGEMRGPSILNEFPAAPPDLSQDRIQVMEPDHTGRYYSVTGKPITIGRDADNTIMLQDQRASRHHARIDFDGTQYRIVDLDSTNGTYVASARLLPGVPEVWNPEKPLRIGDAYLRLLRAQKGGATLSGGPSRAGSIDPNLVRSSPGLGRVGIYLENLQLTTEPGTPLNSSVTILNQGAVVDHFKLSVSGVPAKWVPSLPPPVQLLPGDQQTVTFTLLVPRNPQGRAGNYALTLRVVSQAAPDQAAEVKATLTVSTFSAFSSELYPSKVRANQVSRVTVTNKGNLQASYDLAWKDPGAEITFNPPKASLSVAEGQSGAAEFKATSSKRRWMGGEEQLPFTVQVSPADGAAQIQNGTLVSKGLVPIWAIPALVALCALLGFGGSRIYSLITAGNQNATQSAIAQIATDAARMRTQAQESVVAASATSLAKTLVVPTNTPALSISETPVYPQVETETPTNTPSPVPINTVPVTIETIHMSDELQGWAIGKPSGSSSDKVLFTQDGGNTWTDITPALAFDTIGTENISATAYFSGRQDAWVIFYNADRSTPAPDSTVIWNTADGGQSWKASQPFDLTSIQKSYFIPSNIGFSDNQHGWMMAHLDEGMMHDYVTVFTTSDGGATWTKVVDPTDQGLPQSCYKSGIDFYDTYFGWVTGNCGGVSPGVYFYHTMDGGQTWANQSLPAPAAVPNAFSDSQYACSAYPPQFVLPNNGYALISCMDMNTNDSNSWLYVTEDAGYTWREVSAMTRPHGTLFFLNNNLGWFAGYFTPNAPISLFQITDGGATWSLLGNPWIVQMDFVMNSSGTSIAGFAVTFDGTRMGLITSMDGGASWQTLEPGVIQ